MSSVIATADLENFFRGEFASARKSLGVEVEESAEYYVVNLLCEYSRRGNNPMPGDEPLAFLYKRALEAPTGERILILKNLGDLALYVAGFFTEFIERSLVDVSYYISMGGNAYTSLSDIFGSRPRGGPFAVVYDELARKFSALVDVLMEIADRSRSTNNDDLVRLYDRWTRTGSDRIHRLLVEKGLVLAVRSPDETLQ